MKLARKITFAIAAAILAVMAAHAVFLIRREVVLFDADLARSTNLKRALRASIEETWRAYGDAAAQRLVEETIPRAANGITAHWYWLDAAPGDPRHLELSQSDRDQLRSGERVILFKGGTDGGADRYTYVTTAIEGSRTAVLEFVEPVNDAQEFVATSRREIEITTLVILLLCVGAVYFFGTWYIGRPIERLRDRLRAIAAGDFEGRLDLPQHDEIGELAADVDRMAARLAGARRELAAETEARMAALEGLRHADRLTTVGQLASGVAHELGTPLAVIAGRAEMIVSGEAVGERVTASARSIVEQTTVMTKLIRQLLDFTHRQKPAFAMVDLRDACAHTIDTLAFVARRQGVTVTLAAPAHALVVRADAHQLQQVLANLIVNALQATAKGGRIDVTVSAGHAASPADGERRRDVACVTVADDGAGIAREHLPHLFEPFFTTKDTGEGTGLGLAVVQTIVREHGGWIEVESEVGKGSRFMIFLPPAAEAHTPPQKAA